MHLGRAASNRTRADGSLHGASKRSCTRTLAQEPELHGRAPRNLGEAGSDEGVRLWGRRGTATGNTGSMLDLPAGQWPLIEQVRAFVGSKAELSGEGRTSSFETDL